MRPYKQAKRALNRKDREAFFDLIWSEDDLYQADKKGKHRIIDLILEDKKRVELLEHLFTERGLSPELDTGDPFSPLPILRYCIQARAIELARLVLEQGARVDRVDEQGLGVMHEAVLSGSVPIVELLASFGAEVNLDTLDRGDGQRTPLHLASEQGDTEMVDALLALGADPSILNWRSESALHVAIFHKNQQLVPALVTAGASIDLERHDGKTPLHLAADRRQVGALAYLLRAGAEVDPRDEEGWTPLAIACARGDAQIVEVLLAHGADPGHETEEDVRIRGNDVPAGSRADDIARLLGQSRIEEVLAETERTPVSLDEIVASHLES